MFRRALAVIALAALFAGCEDRTPPPSPSPSPGNGETITGRERLGWDQQAPNAGELASYRYAIYVDGARSELTGVSCAPAQGSTAFACSAQLPPMGNGSRTIEIASFIVDEGTVLESPRSAALRVVVNAAMPAGTSGEDWASGEAGVTSDGVALSRERMIDGLQQPTDAAFAPDGRLFIAERGGRIRIVRGGTLQGFPALELEGLAPDGGLLAIALDPDFARTRTLFALSASLSSRGLRVFRVARYRELAGVMAQRAVLLETPAPPRPSGALRFGPDGKLYIGFSAGDERPGRSPYLGKVVRLNADGSMPHDRRRASPTFSDGHVAPRALAWRPSADSMWIADGNAAGREWITRVGAGEEARRTTWEIPAGETTSSMAFYDGELLPDFRGDLLVASAQARHILRLRFAADDPSRIASQEVLLDEQVGPIHVVLTGPDGAIYFLTDTALGRTAGLRTEAR